jgi:hypothetical protein
MTLGNDLALPLTIGLLVLFGVLHNQRIAREYAHRRYDEARSVTSPKNDTSAPIDGPRGTPAADPLERFDPLPSMAQNEALVRADGAPAVPGATVEEVR